MGKYNKGFWLPNLLSPPMTATTDDTFGALFVGNEISLAAFGFLLLQYWNFCHNWKEESLAVRFIVSFSLILGILLIVLTSHTNYHYLISSMGNHKALTDIVWSLKAEPWISEAVVTLTHTFYAGKIYYMQRSYALSGLLLFLTLTHTGLVLGMGGIALSAKEFGTVKTHSTTVGLTSASLSIGLLLDIIIAFAMFHFFHNNRSEIKSTQSLLNKLTLYTFASGLLTVVSNAVILATYLSKPNAQIYTGASFVLPHLYSNCLLAMLNSRANLRARYNDTPVIPIEPSAILSCYSGSRLSKADRFSHGEYFVEKFEP